MHLPAGFLRIALPMSVMLMGSVSVCQEKTLPISHVERMAAIAELQGELSRSGRIVFRYALSHKQDISKTDMEIFVSDVKTLASTDGRPDVVFAFVRDAFPGTKLYMRDGEFTLDGFRFREKLTDLDESLGAVEDYKETVSNGRNASMYWGDSEQVTVYGPTSAWAHLTFSSFCIYPNRHTLESPIGNDNPALLRFLIDGTSSSDYALVSVEDGMLSELRSGESVRHQAGFQEFDGVMLPKVCIDVDYRNESLYRLAVILVENAEFNRPLQDEFQLSVPAGTVVVDARHGERKHAPKFRIKEPSNDVVRFLEERNVLPNPALPIWKRPLIVVNVGFCALLLGWYCAKSLRRNFKKSSFPE